MSYTLEEYEQIKKHQAKQEKNREYQRKWIAKKRENDPEYYVKQKAYNAERKREKYSKDEDFKKKEREYDKKYSEEKRKEEKKLNEKIKSHNILTGLMKGCDAVWGQVTKDGEIIYLPQEADEPIKISPTRNLKGEILYYKI